MALQFSIVRTTDGNDFSLPCYASEYHCGLILQAGIPSVLKLEPGERVYVPVGFAIGIRKGFCGQIVSIPEVAKEKGLVVMGAPQILNPADREPLFVLIQNESSKQIILHRGDEIAQLLIVPVEQICWDELDQQIATEQTPVQSMLVDEGVHVLNDQKEQDQIINSKREKKTIRERVKSSDEV